MNNTYLAAKPYPTFPSASPESTSDETLNPLWTVEDVAGYLQLQPETIRCMARRGELPAIKLGKVWRFQAAAIHRLLSQSEAG